MRPKLSDNKFQKTRSKSTLSNRQLFLSLIHDVVVRNRKETKLSDHKSLYS